jgi:1-acyl-sn-glycerol-3-phosphate acyltransferase
MPEVHVTKTLVAGLRYVVGYIALTLNGILVLFLYGVSGGRLRRFNAEVVNPIFSKTLLHVFGMRFQVVNEDLRPRVPCIYMFNHNSNLDIFLCGALGLANTHVIISTKTRKVLPLTLINWGCGSFFIPMKPRRAERIEFFKKVTGFLQAGSASIICSPEGVQPSIHGVAKFNKGVFHMATLAKRPIAPLFFEIPEKSNPLQGYVFSKGTLRVHFLPLIPTEDWKLDDLEKNKAEVRSVFVTKFNQTFPESPTL